MAHIKCRGVRGICKNLACEHCGDDVGVYDLWECGQQAGCDNFIPEPERTREGMLLIEPNCIFLEWREFEFEKNVKSCEYDEPYLNLRGNYYHADQIKYLEIDGRVLVGTKEDGG